jgi:DNA-binding beta-propeller fold protein YncE
MLIGVLVAVLISAATAPARAADPYVVYAANRFVDGAVIVRADPATGSLVEISRNGPQGNLFQRPYDLAVEADGDLLVADMGQPNVKDGALIRVDPTTGRQTLLSSGNAFFDPSGVAIAPGGSIYVLDNLAGNNNGAVIRVDPVTGAQQLIASNLGPIPPIIPNLFDLPFGIAVDRDGSIVVANRALAGALPVLGCLTPSGSVFRIGPGNVTSVVTSLQGLSRPLGLTIDRDGSIVVANECGTPDGVGLVRVDPQTGDQVAIAANGPNDALVTPERVAISPSGDYLVSDFNAGPDRDGGIVHVARGSQAQSVVSTGALFNHPMGIGVVTNRPPTAALTAAPASTAAGRPVALDASGSRDPERLRLVYEWDLDGDGTFEAGSGTTPAAAPRFATDGPKIVRVRVNDPHGGRAVAATMLRVDGRMPVITGLRLARVLGLRTPRTAGKGSTPPAASHLRFRLSEAATVTVAMDRARAGRRSGGRCRPKAKRGRRCTSYSRARTLRRAGIAGENAIALRARGLRPGRYRITVSAVDAVGNRSAPRRLSMRIVKVK